MIVIDDFHSEIPIKLNHNSILVVQSVVINTLLLILTIGHENAF